MLGTERGSAARSRFPKSDGPDEKVRVVAGGAAYLFTGRHVPNAINRPGWRCLLHHVQRPALPQQQAAPQRRRGDLPLHYALDVLYHLLAWPRRSATPGCDSCSCCSTSRRSWGSRSLVFAATVCWGDVRTQYEARTARATKPRRETPAAAGRLRHIVQRTKRTCIAGRFSTGSANSRSSVIRCAGSYTTFKTLRSLSPYFLMSSAMAAPVAVGPGPPRTCKAWSSSPGRRPSASPTSAIGAARRRRTGPRSDRPCTSDVLRIMAAASMLTPSFRASRLLVFSRRRKLRALGCLSSSSRMCSRLS